MPAIVKGELFGTGGATRDITLDMFCDGSTFNEFSAVRIATSGTFSNCSRYNSTTLSLSNPATDDTFIFPLEYTYNEATWYSTNIRGTLYHSLGTTNISTSLVKSAIGAGNNAVGLLCTSANVNRYAEYCPDINAPHSLGEFKLYSHNTKGGTSIRCIAPTSVDWQYSYDIKALASKVFKEVSGKPYARTSIQLLKGVTSLGESNEFDLNNMYGSVYTYTAANNYNTTTTETIYAKTRHFNGSTWVDGDVKSFTITFNGDPYQVRFSSSYHAADTFSLTYTCTSSTIGVLTKLVVAGTYGGYVNQYNSGSPETIEFSGPGPIADNTTWNFQLQIGAGNWITVLSGKVP